VTDTFATLDELKAYLQRDDLGPTGILGLEIATGMIQEQTGQDIFRVASDVVKLNGRARERLFLPQLPVNDVVSLSLNGVTLVEDADFGVDAELGAIDRLPRGAFWTVGRRNIIVTYDHGWDDPPAPIRGLCLKWAGKLWQNPTGLTSERTASYSAAYGALIDDDDRDILALFTLKMS
jgi:hypothetical protein